MAKQRTTTQPYTDIHLILQSKGGVGKTVVAALYTEWLREAGHDVAAISTDPANQTLIRYAGLGAQHHEIMDANEHIDQRRFDLLMEEWLTKETTFVVDNGASCFHPLWNYIKENDVVELLERAHRRLFIHNVICGGERLYEDTLRGFSDWARIVNDRRIILWLNDYFQVIDLDNFEHQPEVMQHKNKVAGLIRLRTPTNEIAARNFQGLLQDCKTFREANTDPAVLLMDKHRLARVKQDLFASIALGTTQLYDVLEPAHN